MAMGPMLRHRRIKWLLSKPFEAVRSPEQVEPDGSDTGGTMLLRGTILEVPSPSGLRETRVNWR